MSADTGTYRDYVKALSHRNASLFTLHSFLVRGDVPFTTCNIEVLSFTKRSHIPVTRRISGTNTLRDELRRAAESGSNGDCIDDIHVLQGQIMVIEDLPASIIECLGSELDIDPVFFAKHLYTLRRIGTQNQIPDAGAMPSKLESEEYINILYQTPLVCDTGSEDGWKWVTNAAVQRKVALLRGTTIALAAHAASIIKVSRSSGTWLALIIVDPPHGHDHYPYQHKDSTKHKVRLNLSPFPGTFEDFADPPKFSESWSHLVDKTRGSLFEETVNFWQHDYPHGFNMDDPSPQLLACYTVRVVAAEWVKYVEVMRHCMKLYRHVEMGVPTLEIIKCDLHSLQGWRLRSLNSQEKVESVLRKLKVQNALDSDSESHAIVGTIIKDYEFILSNIQTAGIRLENMLPVVTSLVQIIDTRQSLAETANVTRLTILALTFIPLSYVASLFSMNEKNMPGSDHFWVYFAVAIPVTLAVFLVAKPPTTTLQIAVGWLHDRKQRKEACKSVEEEKRTSKFESAA